jgi:hypothetical protein
LDFSGALLVATRLVRDIARAPAAAECRQLASLAAALDRPDYQRQKQAYFLYREITAGLAAAAAGHPDPVTGEMALALLEARLGHAHYGLHRAAAEAIGSLPLTIAPPILGDDTLVGIDPAAPPAALDPAWLRSHGVAGSETGRWIGRSLVLDAGSRGLLVVKFMRRDESPSNLAREACWMARLRSWRDTFDAPFAIPTPLGPPGAGLMRWAADPYLPDKPPPGLDPDGRVLAFRAAADYFRYPNSPVGMNRLPPDRVGKILGRCARLLGQALARDVVHTAPIPLFHNRTQQHRRTDGGVYDWPRAGRLDRWLHSCRYPNLAQSGLRDFEHFALRDDTAFSRYEWVGVHLLSLFLVAGSYFRTAAPARVGTDAAGRPVDARDLFDPQLLAAMIRSICTGYRQGFAGVNGTDGLPFDLEAVVARMIEEMGVDRHMEEILRRADQRALGRAEFERFLTDRGVAREKAAAMSQGEADILLATGPHLGGFNQSISLPELIRMTGAVAADCIVCRFRRERGWPASGRWKDQVVEDQPPEGRPGGAVKSPAQMG